MADEQFTRCPGCKTVFRVTAAQLELRDGQVRCGHCRTVFDGRAELISLAPPPADEEQEVDELAMGPPTVTLRSARALDPPPPPPPPSEAAPAIDYENRFSDGQGAVPPLDGARVDRDAGARARPCCCRRCSTSATPSPRTCRRPGRCSHAHARSPGCTVRPLRDVAALSIEASDLQADPAHRGLLVLTATIRNRASYAIGYPHLELTLTDAQDQVVVRRALAPADYVSGTANTPAGIAGNAEVPVKLFIDASATSQAGYRLYLFFP